MPTPEPDLREVAAIATLVDHGYHRIAEHQGLTTGSRVRHHGEQYVEAFNCGTATVVAVLRRHEGDVELIVRRDVPVRADGNPFHQWADYHTAAVHPIPAI